MQLSIIVFMKKRYFKIKNYYMIILYNNMDNKNYEMVLIESSKRDQGTSTSFNFSISRPIKNIYRIDLLYAS